MNGIDEVQPQERRRETVGDFLLRRLAELGLKHVFGVAGDFNLEFLEQLNRDGRLEWVGCCNELNAAYAADGYARTAGLSALVTTYGVGELSALCGVAGSYAEHLPVIHIVGAPPIAEIERHGRLHHTAGDGEYRNMLACAREFSAAHARITPETAAFEIDRCLRTCVTRKQPVYLQLPSDIGYSEIATPSGSLEVSWTSDVGMLEEFVRAAFVKLKNAVAPAILADADVDRLGLSAEVYALAERLGCPLAVMGTAKGIFDEMSAHYIGVYSGAYSKPEVRSAIEEADCLLLFGVRFIDSTTGAFSHNIQPQRTIAVDISRAQMDRDAFEGICMRDVVDALCQAVAQRPVLTIQKPAPAQHATQEGQSDAPLTQSWFWRRMERFYRPGDVIVAENGTSLSGVLASSLPSGASVISQALWGAIGYTLPACFGSMMADPERRHLLFIGDGSFQVTVQELSSIFRHKLKPIIFLINNDGYTIERLILGENSSYNEIQLWKYADVCSVFANGVPFDSRRVGTIGEMEAALGAARDADKCFFIEAVMPRMDAPPGLVKLGPVFAKQDYGKSWQRRFR